MPQPLWPRFLSYHGMDPLGAHDRTFEATSFGGALLYSARYHRAPDLFPPDQTWPALYLALAPETSLGEVYRHIVPQRMQRINDYRLSELRVTLSHVLDCSDVKALGLDRDALLDDTDFVVGQELAAAAVARDSEAILVPSATRLGDNLIVFPYNLRPTSHLQAVGSRDLTHLHVDRGS